jgi:hypothetical protein
LAGFARFVCARLLGDEYLSQLSCRRVFIPGSSIITGPSSENRLSPRDRAGVLVSEVEHLSLRRKNRSDKDRRDSVAMEKHVNIAIGTDWSIGGGQNLLDELRFAGSVRSYS